jgi:glyoxylase-like metal-dependent hydrolase (beta-lactamase superfamily II)
MGLVARAGLVVADRWFERERVDDAVTVLTEPFVHPLLRCNIWHVRGRSQDLLVDTGLGIASLRAAAADLFDADLLAVATHAHTDHIGSLHEFERRAIHEAEADAVRCISGVLHLDIGAAPPSAVEQMVRWGYDIREGLLTAIPRAGFDLDGAPRTSAAPTRVLREGDVIDLGDRAFEVLHLPGHSPGSIGLWDAANEVLFSGDAVYDGPLLDEIEGADIDAYVATMRRLRDLPVAVVHAGHEGSMDRQRFRDVIDAYLDRRSR